MDESRVEELYFAAIACESSAERGLLLERSCGDDAALRRRVERLLDARSRLGEFLLDDAPATATGSSDDVASVLGGEVRIGPYRLIEPLGEGGMGTVHVAERAAPVRRLVALKVIRPGMDSREVIARFEAERRVLAMMDHPNIASVLDAGVTTIGRPYFVMELVRGRPITEHCDRAGLSVRERIRLFLDVCGGVRHAHQKGIIHRDLKPSNVLVAEGEHAAIPKVIDFGVAKAIDANANDTSVRTSLTQLVGTPMYMSPEQAALGPLDIDTLNDVYSLGALLHELVTGAPPFESDRLRSLGLDELSRVIREEEPPPPSRRVALSDPRTGERVATARGTTQERLARELRGDLDLIVSKALEKDRNRRYESVGAFAADLERHLRDEPIEAAPASFAYRFRKLTRRHRGILPGIAAGCVAVAALSIGVAAYVTVTREHGRRMAEALRRAEDGERTARLEGYAGRIRLGDVLLGNREYGVLRAVLSEDEGGPGPIDPRGFEWRYLLRESLLRPRVLPSHHQDWAEIRHVSDGSALLSIGRDRVLKTWNPRTCEPIAAVELKFDKKRLANAKFTDDGSRLICLAVKEPDDGSPRELSVWDTRSGARVARGPVEGAWNYECIAAAPDGRTVAFLSESDRNLPEGVVRLWDAETARDRPLGEGPRVRAQALAFSPRGDRLAIAQEESPTPLIGRLTIEVREVATGRRLARSAEFDGRCARLSFDSQGKALTASLWREDRTVSAVLLLDAASGKLEKRFDVEGGRIACAEFSPDGRIFAVSNASGGPIRLWDRSASEFLPPLSEFEAGASSISFAPHGESLAAAFPNGDVGLGLVRPYESPAILPVEGVKEAWAVAFSPDSSVVAVGYDDEAGFNKETLRLWDPRTGKGISTLVGHFSMVADVAFLPDGRPVSASYDRRVLAWSRSPDTPPTILGGGPNRLKCLAISRDGKLLAASGYEPSVRVWDLDSGTLRFATSGEPEIVHRVAFSPDGTLLASADNAGWLTLWSTLDGSRIRVEKEPDLIPGLAFSPDGTLIATGCRDGRVRLHAALGGRPPRLLFGHRGEVKAVAFSPDGKTLATGGEERVVRLWQVATGRELLVLRGLSARVNSVAFSPDGLHLAAALHDGSTRLWHVAGPADFAK